MWTNYHTHCRFCDGQGEPGDYVEEALKQGISCLGFSSHAPVPVPNDWCMTMERYPEYIEEVKKLADEFRDRITILCGLEVDFVPGKSAPVDFSCRPEIDYVIGSVHFVAAERGPGGTVDDHAENVDQLIRDCFRGRPASMVKDYYALIRKMLAGGAPDILGHMDLVKKNNTDSRYFSEQDGWYVDEIEKTIQAIAASDTVLEVNTGAMTRWNLDDFYPSPWILRKCREAGIRVTLDSDCHQPAHVAGSFPRAARIMNYCGYERVSILTNGGWEERKLTEKGLLP